MIAKLALQSSHSKMSVSVGVRIKIRRRREKDDSLNRCAYHGCEKPRTKGYVSCKKCRKKNYKPRK